MALNNDDIVWRALTAEARALRRSGDRDKALAVARASVGVVERLHEAAVEKPATAIPSDAPAAFATLAVLQAESGDAVAAGASASRMRAVDLRNTLAVNEREISRGMSPELRDQERAAATELLSLLAQAARERSLPKPDKDRLATLDERMSVASRDRRTFMSELHERIPGLRLWRGLAPDPAADELAGVLVPGTVFLEFVVDEDDVLVIVSSTGSETVVSAHATSLRRRVLAERVIALLHASTLRDRAAWRKAAFDVAQLIPQRFTSLLASASRIVIVPHDVIWRVPFEALPLGDGYLGDRALVIYAGSRTALVGAAAHESTPVRTVAAVGAPELSAAAKALLLQTAPGWNLRSADAASRETAALSGAGKEDLVLLAGANATEAAFREKTAAASAVHIAAPFRINGASPLFSPIVLAGDPTNRAAEDNGALETREVMNLRLAARVAVLSDGAATSMLDGASAAGVVQWAWLAAGVPSVMIARWTTDPAASDALLVEFYRRIRAGATPAEALHRARAAIRSKPEWAAPFYWAGWMVTGT
jgi:CHAT domain-containing protein